MEEYLKVKKNASLLARFGQFVNAVKTQVIDKRQHAGLKNYQADVKNSLGLNVGSGADGGFLVGTDFTPLLMEMISGFSEFYPRCQVLPAVKGKNFIAPKLKDGRANGARFGGANAQWISEGKTIDVQSDLKFEAITTGLNKLAAVVVDSEELENDFEGFGNYILNAITKEFSWQLDNKILRGSGLGEPFGILNSGALITVAKESGQAANTIVLQNVLNMITRFDVRSWKNAVFFANLNCLPQILSLSQIIGTAGTSVVPIGNVAPNITLAGRPVVFTEQNSSVGNLGDFVLADMSQYLVRESVMKTDLSMHVYFLSGQNVYRFIMKANGLPVINVPILPTYGNGTTVSPFVALATR